MQKQIRSWYSDFMPNIYQKNMVRAPIIIQDGELGNDSYG